MIWNAAGFEWDEGNRVKCLKHGMTAAEIEALLRGNPRIAPDPKHSLIETRFVAIGRTGEGRAGFVVFTMRGDLIRPLSARFMHAREVAEYETQSPRI